MLFLTGICVILPILSYFGSVEDGIIGLVGSVLNLFRNIILATAPTQWVVYLGKLQK